MTGGVVLFPTDLQWAAGSGGSVPEGAVECEGSFVGRAHHDGGIIVGPVVCEESCCMIGYCGEQFNKDEYEVMSLSGGSNAERQALYLPLTVLKTKRSPNAVTRGTGDL